MTGPYSKQAILENSFDKAISNGWNPVGKTYGSKLDGKYVYEYFEIGDWSGTEDNWKLIIFNHDFAKALWGQEIVKEDYYHKNQNGTYKQTVNWAWAYHLQQMVVAEDPIKYLGDNL